MSTAEAKTLGGEAPPAEKEPIEGELVDTVAETVNKLHEEAKSSAVDAVKKAVECGEVLIEQKLSLKHGEWGDWISENLSFSEQTARLYIKAAKSAKDGLPFTSLRQLYGNSTQVGPQERSQSSGARDKADLSQTEREVVELNECLENADLPAMSAEEFVAKAGVNFLTEKAATKLEWLVSLLDTILNRENLEGEEPDDDDAG